MRTKFFTFTVSYPHIFATMVMYWIVAFYEWVTGKRRLLPGGRVYFLSTQVKLMWARQFLKFHKIKVVRKGTFVGELSQVRGAIFVSNHQSVIDIPIVMAVLPAWTSFIAKKELRRIPVFGRCAEHNGTLFIDRSRGSDNAALDEVGLFLKDGGVLFVCPEGTRTVTGELLPFKRGAFAIAIASKAPIIPITIKGSIRSCPKNSLVVQPATVELFVDQPISTAGLTDSDRHQLSEQVRSIIAKNLEK